MTGEYGLSMVTERANNFEKTLYSYSHHILIIEIIIFSVFGNYGDAIVAHYVCLLYFGRVRLRENMIYLNARKSIVPRQIIGQTIKIIGQTIKTHML